MNTTGQVLDAAALAAQNISAVADLAGSPEAMANALVWAQKRITELESVVAVLQSPEAKNAEAAIENAGEVVVKAIPAAWLEKVDALMVHAEAALGFRHVSANSTQQ